MTLKGKEQKYFFNTYKRLEIEISKGDGCYLFTRDGRKILDMFAGLAVNVLGYNHPKINSSIKEQLEKYIHVSNYFLQEPQINLAEKILKMSGFSKIFFCNSGTEATESAIKLIRKYFNSKHKTELISFTGAFHGRTTGALALTAKKKYKQQFEPLIQGVKILEFNSVEQLEKNVNENTAAIFIECVQGEGGVNIATQEFVETIKHLSKKHECLIIADEIQSGVGRTGKLHAYEHYDFSPDIVLLAKGIGGGLPLGAMLGSEKVKDVFVNGEHGSTFGGNPVSCAAGLVVFNEIENGLMENVIEQSRNLKMKLLKIKSEYSSKIKDVRIKGLMAGIELFENGETLVNQMLEENVLVNCTNENVIRLLPPLNISCAEIEIFVEKFRKVFKN